MDKKHETNEATKRHRPHAFGKRKTLCLNFTIPPQTPSMPEVICRTFADQPSNPVKLYGHVLELQKACQQVLRGFNAKNSTEKHTCKSDVVLTKYGYRNNFSTFQTSDRLAYSSPPRNERDERRYSRDFTHLVLLVSLSVSTYLPPVAARVLFIPPLNDTSMASSFFAPGAPHRVPSPPSRGVYHRPLVDDEGSGRPLHSITVVNHTADIIHIHSPRLPSAVGV